MIRVCCASLVLLTVWAGGCAVPQSQDTPVQERLLTEPITGRAYYLYVSSKYDPAKPAPVIISCQGTAPYDTADGQVKEWKKIAEDHGVILICPTLTSSDGILTGSDAGLIQRLLNDERFILTILGELHYLYNIDRRNIFLTGWSGGGYPVYFIGPRHPDLFAAVVARQPTFRRGCVDGWHPEAARDIPLLIFYGTADVAPVPAQAREAAEYFRSQGFRRVDLTTVEGGHARHPDLAMKFFLKHWNREPYVSGPYSPHRARLD